MLTIENEMLKQARGEATENTSQAQVYAHASVKQAEEAERHAAEVAERSVPKAPDELADLETHMRSKYAELERKYQQDVADSKRAAEMLSTQCAAQSSLVAALKQELAGVNDLLLQHKQLLSQTEAGLTTDVQRARAEIASLRDQLADANAGIAAGQRSVETRDTMIADLRAALAQAQSGRTGAEAARNRTLDAYARCYTAMRVLLKCWRMERMQRLAGEATVSTVRTSQDAAEARAETAESDVAMARAAQSEAVIARDEALAMARTLRSRLELAELAVQRAQADAEARSAALDDMRSTLTAIVLRAERAESTVVSLASERDDALKRGATLERELTRSITTCDDLRTVTGNATQSLRDADARSRDLSERLSEATGCVAALQHAAEEEGARMVGLERACAAERDARIAAETEVARLSEELSKRPPLDALRALDIDSLLHRNLEAAAAMQSLLAFAAASQAMHASLPTSSRSVHAVAAAAAANATDARSSDAPDSKHGL